jgi:hypothetical protein
MTVKSGATLQETKQARIPRPHSADRATSPQPALPPRVLQRAAADRPTLPHASPRRRYLPRAAASRPAPAQTVSTPRTRQRRAEAFAGWKHRCLLFRETRVVLGYKGLPSISSFLDSAWAPADKAQLIEYLEASPDTVTSSGVDRRCPFCDRAMSGDAWLHSDGVWVWPHDLPHYMRDHSLRLPDRFVSEIRRRNYAVLSPEKVDWNKLDWPLR